MIKKGFKLFFVYKDQKILLSEFTSNSNNTNTIDENLEEKENDSYTLTFSIINNIENYSSINNFNFNTYLKIGRKLILELWNNTEAYKTIELIISSISPVGSNKNIKWNVTAQDYFSFILSKNKTNWNLDTIEGEDYLTWLDTARSNAFDSLFESEGEGELNIGAIVKKLNIKIEDSKSKVYYEENNKFPLFYDTSEFSITLPYKENLSLRLINNATGEEYINADSSEGWYCLGRDYFFNFNYNNELKYWSITICDTKGESSLIFTGANQFSFEYFNNYNTWTYNRDLYRSGTVKDILEYILQKSFLQSSETIQKTDWTIKEYNNLDSPLYKKYNLVLSNTNTYNAIIELSYLTNSLLVINYENKTLDLIDKNDDLWRKNYILSPDFNLQSLDLTYNSDTFYPILFVNGGENEYGATVGLIPYLTYTQYNIIYKALTSTNVDLREETNFYSELFKDNPNSPDENTLKILDNVPYLDSFILSLDYFQDNNLINDEDVDKITDIIYNQLSIINVKLQELIYTKYEVEDQIYTKETDIEKYAEELGNNNGEDYLLNNNNLSNMFYQNINILNGISIYSQEYSPENHFLNNDNFAILEDLYSNGYAFYPETNPDTIVKIKSLNFGATEIEDMTEVTSLTNKQYYKNEIDGVTTYWLSSPFTKSYPITISLNSDNSYLNNKNITFTEENDTIIFDTSEEEAYPLGQYIIKENFIKDSNFNISKDSSQIEAYFSPYVKNWVKTNNNIPVYLNHLPYTRYGKSNIILITQKVLTNSNLPGGAIANKYKLTTTGEPIISLELSNEYTWTYYTIQTDPSFPNFEELNSSWLVSTPIDLEASYFKSFQLPATININNSEVEVESAWIQFEEYSEGGDVTKTAKYFFYKYNDETFAFINYEIPALEEYNELYFTIYIQVKGVGYQGHNTCLKETTIQDLATLKYTKKPKYIYELEEGTSEYKVYGDIQWYSEETAWDCSWTISDENPYNKIFHYYVNPNISEGEAFYYNNTNNSISSAFAVSELTLSDYKIDLSSITGGSIYSCTIINDTFTWNENSITYPYFDLLIYYRGFNYIEDKLQELKEKIINYIDIKNGINDNIKAAQITLATLQEDEVTNSDEIGIVEGEISALETRLSIYQAAIDNYSYDANKNLIKGEGTGKYTIIYEMFNKYYEQYKNDKNVVKNYTDTNSVWDQYQKTLKEKEALWYNLKQNYGQYLYEGYYENTLESNSWNLFVEAEKVIKYHQTPTEDYSITYIDGSNVVGTDVDIDLITVGDYINLRGEKLGIVKNELNEIQVTAISRNLRDYSNIQLTVQQVRQLDSIIEKIIAS